MKTVQLLIAALFITGSVAQLFGQETPPPPSNGRDTTRFSIGKGRSILIISSDDVEVKEVTTGDTIDASPDDDVDLEAHFAGLEFGPMILLNSSMNTNFPSNKQWENDPGKSFTWNLNVLEHKFSLYKNYIGLTTGLGVNFTQLGLRQYVLNTNSDSLWAVKDTVNNYDKNKLRAVYLQVPLLLEFCSKESGEEGFYLAAGVIGGLRLASSVKTVIATETKDVRAKNKGEYALNAFRMDAAVKFGYKDWGLFANYNVLPLFDTKMTEGVYPLTFGLTCNF